LRSITDALQAVEDFVSAYEAARHRQAEEVDLLDFLPARDHPQFSEVVVELIRVDLEHSWRQGTPKYVADYERLFPDLLSDSSYLEPVAFEEYRQRRIAGERACRDEYSQAFRVSTDSWPDLPIGDVLDRPVIAAADSRSRSSSCASALQSGSGLSGFRPAFPEVGDRFLNFELVSELGRGALGRVYLARQCDLARRFVALKITAAGYDEAQRLAQLQHTNIIPIYSFHSHESLQAVCMPFLGRRTLADVVQSYRCGQPIPASGQALVGTVGVHFASTISTQQTAEEQAVAIESQCKLVPRTEVIRRMENMTFIDASTWMISRVADGLAHAHGHGIVHRDLKPANILLSDDGEPLILDFHLSAYQPAEAVLGGTLPYMSVEQLNALLTSGDVGPKSDIYSLGVILFEMLTGASPYPIRLGSVHDVISKMLEDRRHAPRPVRQLNKRVSPDLESIVDRCLAPDPNVRYESARQLHEDLVRHLEHRPLRYARNRSLVERSRKWAKRHPRLFSASSIAIFAFVAIMMLGAALFTYSRRVAHSVAVDASQDMDHELREARSTLNNPYAEPQALADAIVRAKSALTRHGVFRTRDLDSIVPFANLNSAERIGMKEDAGELLYLLANASGQLALRKPDALRKKLFTDAIRYSDLSQELLNQGAITQAVSFQKRRLSEASDGKFPSLNFSDLKSSATDPRDLRLLAYEAFHRQDFEAAVKMLREVSKSNPEDPAVWYSLGNCYLGLENFSAAEHCYDSAIVLGKDFTLAHELRGFACLGLYRSYKEQVGYDPHTRQNEKDARAVAMLEAAQREFDSVLVEKPHSVAALVNRSLVLQEMGDIAGAIRDISAAIELGKCPTRLYFVRADLKKRLKDTQGADEDRRKGFELTPNDESSWIARGIAMLPTNHEAALADFRQALKLYPQSISARRNIVHVLSERLDQAAEAISILSELLAVNPNDARTRVDRGVLYARLGKRDEAIADADATLKISDRPLHIYQCACVYALTARQNPADAETALQLISRALKEDLKLSRIMRSDHDLDAIRTHPKLQPLLDSALTLQQVP